MSEFIDILQRSGGMLGFAGTGIALAYIGFLLASLLCVFYGLITWNKVRRVRYVRSPRKRLRLRVGSLIRRRRVKKIRRPRRMRKARR